MKITHKLICYFIGHKNDMNDSGYDVCSRCGKHGYYDYPNYYNTIPDKIRILRLKIKYLPMKIRSWYRWKFFNELPF